MSQEEKQTAVSTGDIEAIVGGYHGNQKKQNQPGEQSWQRLTLFCHLFPGGMWEKISRQQTAKSPCKILAEIVDGSY